MLILYSLLTKLINRKKEKPYKIITKNEHNLQKDLIDFNALKIIRRLKGFGFDAYIVGGAVRDCLLGKTPKDFDVATNATPKEIKRHFSNSRIIGNRFKLVHIIFKDMVIEVATFRSASFKNVKTKENIIVKDNSYGTIAEDATRRDFGINALYYDPEKEIIIDYVDGYEDVKNKVIRLLKKPSASFQEDPVRMLRAVKYSAIDDCEIDEKLEKIIIKYSGELGKSSVSRLYEEINKILKSGKTALIIEKLYKTKLLKYLIPFLSEEFDSGFGKKIIENLEKFDKNANRGTDFDICIYWAIMLHEKLLRVNFDTKSETYMADIRAFFYNDLSIMRVPNKIIDFLSKAYIAFFKMQVPANIHYTRRIKKYSSFPMALYLLKFFDLPKELIDLWDKKDIPDKKKHKTTKPKPPIIEESTTLDKRKFVMTKNYNGS